MSKFLFKIKFKRIYFSYIIWVQCYPLASEVSGEVANLTEEKTPSLHIMRQRFVGLSQTLIWINSGLSEENGMTFSG